MKPNNNGKQFSFEKLDVWQNSIDLTVAIYKLTDNFPVDQKYNLTSQIRRACISVSSNIAEGNYRITNKDKGHFMTIAYGSIMEVINQLIIANRLNYVSDEALNQLRDDIQLIANQINKLKKYHIDRK